MIAPRQFPLGGLSSGQLSLRIIAPEENYHQENSPREKLTFECFLACIVVPPINDPKESCPPEKLSRGYITPEIFFPEESEIFLL